MSVKDPGQNRRAWVAVVLAILVILVLTTALMPQGALAASNNCRAKHTVRSFDTLKSIAARYNAGVADIVTVNHIAKPYVIYVGQNLCIPQGSVPGNVPTYATLPAANFYPTVSARELHIRTENFPTNSTFYVKVSGARTGENKIGLLKIKNTGTVTRSFELPVGFRNSSRINVCLKNAMTDVNICRLVFY